MHVLCFHLYNKNHLLKKNSMPALRPGLALAAGLEALGVSIRLNKNAF
jgi:hypothetical protein